jgi:tetratricopeptide (TPR) repeat protein
VAFSSLCLCGVLSAQVLGRITFPTSGSASAQPHFIRGVLLLHSFEYDEAISEFRDAQRIDPAFAMAYWGEAMCYDQPLWYHEEVAKARAVLDRLAPTAPARQAKAPTLREKGYLDAVDRLFGFADKSSRNAAYAARMLDLTRAFPDDDEAAAFYALALLATIPSGERNPSVSLKAGAIATAILKRNPQHPGAAHYALHAYDDGEHAAMGLEAARIYAKIAPASSHARHMPSHIFLPLGMWDEAAAADESAFAASVDYVKSHSLSQAQLDFHSLSWLQYEYLQQGRFKKATEVMEIVKRALDGAGSGSAEASPYGKGSGVASPHGSDAARGLSRAHHEDESEIGRGFDSLSLKNELASMRARLIVESGRWDLMRGQGSFDNIDELLALGLSSVRLKDFARADAAVEELTRAASTVPDHDAREVTAIMAAEVDGVLRFARGDRIGGLAALAGAAGLEAKRPRPVGRPYPIKPAGELYGEALSAAGDPSSSIQQFRSALVRTPNRAAALIGLAQAAQSAGLTSDARRAAKGFLTIWHAADADRPEISVAKALATPPGK